MRPIALACGVVVAALAIAMPDVASGVKTKSASTEVEGVQAGTVSAKCKRGQKAVSGGFAAPAPDPSFIGPDILLYESLKAGGRSWTVSGYNSGGEPGTLTAYAYCDKGRGSKARSNSTELDAGEADTVTATCKRGQKAVSGGFESPDFDPTGSVAAGITAYESRKAGRRKWTVSAFNASAEAGTLTAHAYCRATSGPKTKEQTIQVAAFPGAGTASAKCKRGQRAISGGFANPDFDPAGVGPYIRIHESRKAGGRKWTVSGANLGLGSGTLTAYVYCQKKS